MEFDLHSIKSIIATKIEGHGGTFWREIKIVTESGEILELDLFSKDVDNLIIKKQ